MRFTLTRDTLYSICQSCSLGAAKMAAYISRCISEIDLAQGNFPKNLSVCENENLKTFLPIPHRPGLFPGTYLAMAPCYPSDEFISTRHGFPFLLSANKNEEVKRNALSQQISIWFSPSRGQFLQCVNHSVAKSPMQYRIRIFRWHAPVSHSHNQSQIWCRAKASLSITFPATQSPKSPDSSNFLLSDAMGPS